MPLVSVIIPAFNAERTIRQALDSVLGQTVSDLEVLVVDDGSTDRTIACARGADPRVTVAQQRNAGPSEARNHGARLARGAYLGFLDADDVWLAQKLERQLARFAADPGIDAVQCGAFYVDQDLRMLEAKPCVDSDDPLWDSVTFRNLPAFPQSIVFRRQVFFERVGPFDTALTGLEDWEMAIRTAWRCRLASVPEPLVMRRLHPGCRSHSVDINVTPGPIILDRFFNDSTFPERIKQRRRRAYAAYYTSLAGGYFQHRRLWPCAKWALRSLWTDPRQLGYMAALPLRVWQRARLRLAEAAR